METISPESGKSQHLCVVVHGIWGSPNHVQVMADTLRAKHTDDGSLHILNSKGNCRSLTYDGIEVGGQRLYMEILDEVANLAARGSKITRISMAVYSYGGLFARYAIGLLESQGFFHKVQPVNFSAFASPFLGTRSPVQGWRGDVVNSLFSSILCATGRELFLIDNFKGTGRPLLDILADKNSTFMKGLSRFQRRSLYGNIINDPSVVYYTGTISTTEPYADPASKVVYYIEGYENIIIDIHRPATPRRAEFDSRLSQVMQKVPGVVYECMFLLGMTVFIPAFGTLLVLTHILQSLLSPRRIYWHQKRVSGIRGMDHTLPLISAALSKHQVQRAIGDMHEAAENIREVLNHKQGNQYLIDKEQSVVEDQADNHHSQVFATLALSERQFAMAKALNDLGWRKYPVHIHKVKRAHAALIVRISGSSFDEGKIVLRHWVEEEFIH